MEPSHEEDSERQAMCEKHQGGVVPEAPGVDVPDHVILKNGHPVIHVSPAHMLGNVSAIWCFLQSDMLFVSNNVLSPRQPKLIHSIGLVQDQHAVILHGTIQYVLLHYITRYYIVCADLHSI